MVMVGVAHKSLVNTDDLYTAQECWFDNPM